jgi:anti-sigma regulatory factor (Ser/Thr protein kinase)
LRRAGHFDRIKEAGISSSSEHPEADQEAIEGSLKRSNAPVEQIPVTHELWRLRRRLSASAVLAPLPQSRRQDFVVAVNEGAINALEYGEEPRTARLWRQGGSVIADVVARGRVADPPSRRRPDPGALRGRGLWIAGQLCDRVQLRQEGATTRLRLQMRVA